MTLAIENFNSKNILSSFNFARRSEVVFCEEISYEDFSKIENKNTEVIYKKDKTILYLNKKFNLNNNSTIFSNTYLVESLFKIINSRDLDFSNLRLISHQADHKIEKKLYNKKPHNFSKWFGINIDHKHEDLVPIPLGLSNNYSPKNIRWEHFLKYKNIKKDIFIYSNFQVNTNYFERTKILKNIKNKNFVTKEGPALSVNDYAEKLSKSSFVICPFGNGIDTHRYWESLYFNSIPITIKHLTYETSKNLPAMLIDSFESLSENECRLFLEDLKSKEVNYDPLTVDYWMKTIMSEPTKKQNEFEISLTKDEVENIKNKLYEKLKKEQFYKKYNTLQRKIHKKLNLFK